jgi:hypothetical protein
VEGVSSLICYNFQVRNIKLGKTLKTSMHSSMLWGKVGKYLVFEGRNCINASIKFDFQIQSNIPGNSETIYGHQQWRKQRHGQKKA